MKKILFIAFLFVSFIANAQISALPKPSTSMPFGLLDVRSFGAIGDSTTDNTTAFRACFAEAGRLHTGVFIPSGNWVITDSVIVAQRVSVWGVGGQVNNNNELGAGNGEIGFASTNILMQGNNKSVFVIDPLDTGSIAISNTGNTFKDFAVIYQGTTPTSNAGIRLIDGGSYDMYNVSATNFWIDLDVLASAYPNLLGCHFNNYAYVGIRIQNTKSPDWGGTTMTNCTILTGKYSGAYAGLLWGGSGAFRMSNCEFNLTDLTHITKYCIVLDNSVQGPTQEIYFDNTSLSAFDSAAFFAVHLAPLTKGIFLNNMYAYGPITDSANQAAFQFNTASQAIQQIHLSNLSAASAIQNKAGYQPAVISCTNTNLMTVTNITHGAYYTGPDVVCTNCQSSTAGVKDLGLNTGFQDANGQPLYTRIGSKFGLDLIINDTLGAVAQGNYGLRFFNGTANVGGITTAMQFNLGQGTPATFLSTWPQVYSEKDTAGKVGIVMRNSTASANASASYTGIGNNASFSLFTTASGWTPYKSIRASSTGLWASGSGNLDILYDGGSLTMSDGALGASPVDFAIKSHNVGIYTTGTPAAMLELGGSNYNNPNNAAGGNMFAIKANIIQNTTTGVSGTVAQYAISGFAKPTMYASNTGVTYTKASTIYIDGAPIDGTNVTTTNRYALFINAGASQFGPPTTTTTTLNLPTGTAVTSPNQGDMYATTGHLFYRDQSTTYDLLAPSTPTWQQTLTAGSTLTGNNTIVNGGHDIFWTGTGSQMFNNSTNNSTGVVQITSSSTNQLALHNTNSAFVSFLVSSAGNLSIIPNPGNTVTFPHFEGVNVAIPTTTGLNGSVSSATVSAGSTDNDLTVTVVTSGSITAGTTLFTLTYNSSFSTTPKPLICGQNAASAAIAPYVVGASASTATVGTGGNIVGANTYVFTVLTQR